VDERRIARPHRPAPVAGIVAEAAFAEQGALAAKTWLVDLLRARPLAAAGELPVADLAAGAPVLCEALLRALGSDAELDRLSDDADLRELAEEAGRLAGAADAAGTLAAVEALRSALWAVVCEGAALSDAPRLAPLADRLAHVCAVVAGVAVAAAPATAGAGFRSAEPHGRPRAGPGPEPDRSPLWVAALERQLLDGGHSNRRFALLLVDLDGAERLSLADPADGVAAAFDRVGQAIRSRVRRQDVLAHERDGRTWLIAPDSGRDGALALAERVAGAVAESAVLRGVPLTASVGIAVYPHDGRDAQALIEHAEEEMFAARAAGLRVAQGP